MPPLPVPKAFVRRAAAIAIIRVFVFVAGWLLTTRFSDWRQSAGYPLIILGALPDAILVRYAVAPNSTAWPLTMVVSLVLSSSVLAALIRRHD